MSKKIIKSISILAIAVMLLGVLLTGCGEAQQPAVTSSATSTPKAQEEPVTVVKDPTVITYTSFRVEDYEIWKKLAKKFESENPGVIVKLDFPKDTTIYYANLKANIASGVDMDIFDIHPNLDFYTYAKDGTLVDLSDFDFVNNYLDSAKKLTTVNGKVYGYNQAINMICAIYNKDIFAQLGINAPATFDELLTVAKKVKDNGYGGLCMPYANGWLANALIVESMGGDEYVKFQEGIDSGAITDIRTNESAYNSLKTLAAYYPLLFDGASTLQYPDVLSLFAQKKAAVMMMGTWTFGTKETDYPGINQGIFGWPLLDKGEIAYAEAAQISCIYSKSKHLEEAKKWLQFITTPENVSTYINSAKMTPTLRNIEMNFEGADTIKAQMDKGINISGIPNLKNNDVWVARRDEMWTNIIFNGKDVESEIDAFNAFLVKADLKNMK